MKKGDIISTTEYLIVEKEEVKDGENVVLVKNLETQELFGLSKSLAEGYDKAESSVIEAVTQSQIATLLEGVGSKVFSVTFTKKPDPKMVALKIGQLTKFTKKNVETCLLGEVRTIRGRLVSTEPKMGRSKVIDLDIPKETGEYDNRQRQVDHRTITSLTVNSITYTIK